MKIRIVIDLPCPIKDLYLKTKNAFKFLDDNGFKHDQNLNQNKEKTELYIEGRNQGV